MNLRVSHINNRVLRRTVIVASYPLMAAGCVVACAWNFLVDVAAWQVSLARSARKEW